MKINNCTFIFLLNMVRFRVIKKMFCFLLIQVITDGIPVNNLLSNTGNGNKQTENLNREIFDDLADIYKILSRHALVNFPNIAKALSADDYNRTIENRKVIPSTQVQTENAFTLISDDVLLQSTISNIESRNKDDTQQDVSYSNLLSLHNLSLNAKVQSSVNQLPRLKKYRGRAIKKHKKRPGWRLKNNVKHFQDITDHTFDKADEKLSFQNVGKDKDMSKPAFKSNDSLPKTEDESKSSGIKRVRTYIKHANHPREKYRLKTTPWNNINKYKMKENKGFERSFASSAKKSKTENFKPVRRYMRTNVSHSISTSLSSTMDYEHVSETIENNEPTENGGPEVGLNDRIWDKFGKHIENNNLPSNLAMTGVNYETVVTDGKRYNREVSGIHYEENYPLSKQFVDYIQTHSFLVISFLAMCFLILSLLIAIVFLFGKNRGEFLEKTWKSIKASPRMFRKFDLPARPQDNYYHGTFFETEDFVRDKDEGLLRGKPNLNAGANSLFCIGSASDSDDEVMIENAVVSNRFGTDHLSKPMLSKSFNAVNEQQKDDHLSKNVTTAPSEKLIKLHSNFSCKKSLLCFTPRKSRKSSYVKQHESSESFPQMNTENATFSIEDKNSVIHSEESAGSNNSKDHSIENSEQKDQDAMKETTSSKKLLQLHRNFSCKESMSSNTTQKSESSEILINIGSGTFKAEDKNRLHSLIHSDESANSNDSKGHSIKNLEPRDQEAVKELSEIIYKLDREPKEQLSFESNTICWNKLLSRDEGLHLKINKEVSEPLQKLETENKKNTIKKSLKAEISSLKKTSSWNSTRNQNDYPKYLLQADLLETLSSD